MNATGQPMTRRRAGGIRACVLGIAVLASTASCRTTGSGQDVPGKKTARPRFFTMSHEQRGCAGLFVALNTVGIHETAGRALVDEAVLGMQFSWMLAGYTLPLSMRSQDVTPVWREMIKGVQAFRDSRLDAARRHFVKADALAPGEPLWPRFCALVLDPEMKDTAPALDLVRRMADAEISLTLELERFGETLWSARTANNLPGETVEAGLVECFGYAWLCSARMLRSGDWNAESVYLRVLLAQQLLGVLQAQQQVSGPFWPDSVHLSPATLLATQMSGQSPETRDEYLAIAARRVKSHKESAAAHWLLAYLSFATAQEPCRMTPEIAVAAQAALDLGYRPVDGMEHFLLLTKAHKEKDDIQQFRQAVLVAEAATDLKMDTRIMRTFADKAARRIRDDASLKALDDEILAKAVRLWPKSRHVRKLIARRDACRPPAPAPDDAAADYVPGILH